MSTRKSMCGWSDCQKDGEISLSGNYGTALPKTRTSFCCIEHLTYWCVKRLGFTMFTVSATRMDEKTVESSVESLVRSLSTSTQGDKS